MRLAKYFAGAVAILLALWIIIGEQITGASSNAVVNSRISTLRSPIHGIFHTDAIDVGEIFEPDSVVAKIDNPHFDYSRLLDLQQKLSNRQIDLEALSNVSTNSNNLINQIQRTIDEYTVIFLSKNKNAIASSEERIRLFEEVESARVFTKGAKLSVKSLNNIIELSRATEDIRRLREVRRAVLNGLFFGEELRELHQLKINLIERNLILSNNLVQMVFLKNQILILKNRIIEEKRITGVLSKAELKAQSKSVLWEKLVSEGEVVKSGSELFKLALCNYAIVTLSVSSGVYNSLEVGQNARFVSDKNGKTYEAKIRRLAGSGATKIYKGLAIPPRRKDEERFDVVLIAPKIREEVSKTCSIGITGRVFFDGRPFDWLRDLIN